MVHQDEAMVHQDEAMVHQDEAMLGHDWPTLRLRWGYDGLRRLRNPACQFVRIAAGSSQLLHEYHAGSSRCLPMPPDWLNRHESASRSGRWEQGLTLSVSPILTSISYQDGLLLYWAVSERSIQDQWKKWKKMKQKTTIRCRVFWLVITLWHFQSTSVFHYMFFLLSILKLLSINTRRCLRLLRLQNIVSPSQLICSPALIFLGCFQSQILSPISPIVDMLI